MSTTVVLITGANTGIGYETVKALLQSREEKKYHILLGARSGEKGSEAVKKLKEEISSTRSEIEAVLIDIDGDESIERLVKEVEGKVGRVDVLINNAGTSFVYPHTLQHRA